MKARIPTAWLLSALGAIALLLPARGAEAQGASVEVEAEAEAEASFEASASFGASVRLAHGPPHHHRRHGHGRVYVNPAPPPPPSPTVVVVEEEQPPPPPQVTVHETRTVHRTHAEAHTPPPPQREPRHQDPKLGFHLELGGVAAKNVQMGGAGAAFRLRPSGYFGVDFGVGAYAGTDYNGLDRTEVPLTIGMLFFANPGSPLQLYFTLGPGLAFAHAEGTNEHTGLFESRDFSYIGGQAGIGLEWRIGRHFALNISGKGFIRQRVDDNDDDPEFVEFEDGVPTGNTSDTSAGGVANLGMTFYF
ncbi:MAG: outer membrane beta-barrel protein [Polyangiales bacterium]